MTEFCPHHDSDFSAVARMCGWYTFQCNSDWEHQFGISIQTMDNPGWSLKIDLQDTQLALAEAEISRVQRSEHDWMTWQVSAEGGTTKFQAFGGPNNLAEMIQTFVKWAESVSFKHQQLS